MKARLAEVQAELRSIHEEAGDAALSEERQGDWDTLDGELTSLRDQIAKAEARMARVAELSDKPGNTERGNAPAFVKTHTDSEVFDLDSIRQMSYSGDDFLDKVADNAKRAVERSSYGVKDKEAAQERAEELLDTVDNSNRELAKRMLLTGSKDYESGFTKVLRHGTDAFCTNEERQALIRANQALNAGGSGANGGYAVPFQLDPTVILTSAGVRNPLRELARVETIVGKVWQGVTSSGTTVSRGAEASTAPASNFTLAQPEVSTNRVQGYTVFSMEIDLSWSALRSEITRMLVDAKGAEEADSFVNGDGTGVNPGGILKTLTGQDVSCAVEDAFGLADLFALEEALDARWEDNASYLAHKTVYNKIRQFPTDGSAGSMNNLWTQNLADGNPRRLLDTPAYRSTAMPSLATALANDATPAGFMLYGDFKQFLIVDRIGMTVELVPHVFDGTVSGGVANNRPTGQRGVYAVWMNNSKILVPGAFKKLVTKDAS
jgi:HK97 family phage major capsid protein